MCCDDLKCTKLLEQARFFKIPNNTTAGDRKGPSNGYDDGTVFAFTDGSCLTIPGPCGARAAIYIDHHQPVHLKRPVARRGSILLGELVAILITQEYILENLTNILCRLLKIFSDSQPTVGILTLNWKDTSYRDVTKDIRKTINHLQQSDIAVEID